MADEVKKEIQLEIAHVLFIDIVGYSKLSINEQHASVDELTQIVRASEQFQRAEAANRLLKIPTGDGMALVFYTSPEAPAQCAVEISRALKEHPRLQLRMGIHSGPVSGVVDVNERASLAGAGINMAQRVMACGDAGHILLSKHIAEDLEEYERWRPLLHDLGSCEVKHGVRVTIVSLYDDQFGNATLPRTLETIQKRRKRLRWATMTAALLALAMIAAGIAMFSRYRIRSTLAAPKKSIAVLPFENLSQDPENAYFADGVQDEILTDLDKVADLKVISRTSVMQYKNAAMRNLREIAQQLGVSHMLEGSVQRAANRIRVNAQLIDARTDTHLWAEHYDRPLGDVFAIQSEIAKAVADQLQAKLSPREKAVIEQQPTADIAAYDDYVRAKTLLAVTTGARQGGNLYQAQGLLEQAIARDPAFFLAHCKLAWVHKELYYTGFDHSARRLAQANETVRKALELGPDRGEAHLAAGWVYYHCYFDYHRARSELAIARSALPNEPEVFELAGYMDRRQGHWREHIQNLERAAQLDPRNVQVLHGLAQGYKLLRQFPDLAAVLDRILAITPADPQVRVMRASVDLEWHADTSRLRAVIHDIISEDPSAGVAFTQYWV